MNDKIIPFLKKQNGKCNITEPKVTQTIANIKALGEIRIYRTKICVY